MIAVIGVIMRGMRNNEAIKTDNNEKNEFSQDWSWRRRLGKRLLGLRNWGEKGEKDSIVRDSGVAAANKDSGASGGDAFYHDPKDGIFGVFDDADNEKATAVANLALLEMKDMLEEEKPERVEDLVDILESASDTVHYDDTAGFASGTIGRIVEKNGGKVLLYASVGSSRLYHVRDGEANQLTVDESGNENLLGHSDLRVKQAGELILSKGDKVVFCSSGIEVGGDLGNIVEQASSATKATNELVRKSPVANDRTVIVAEV